MPEVKEAAVNVATTNVTITTTTETVAVSSGEVRMPTETATVMIIAWGQLTTGAATTTVTPRIRRGTTTSGTLVGEANAEQVKVAAGNTEPFFLVATEERQNVDAVEYSLTLQQAGATGNGTVLQAGICLFLL